MTMLLVRWFLHLFGVHWWREWGSDWHAGVRYKRCRICHRFETIEPSWDE